MDELDLISRDKNELNKHLGTLSFDEVLGEPDGIHSIDCVWKASYCCFEFWKGVCYKLMTTLCGMCIAMEWGCEFAYIAFLHIWFITPSLKIFDINCSVCQKIYGLCIGCLITPICEACGGLFLHFKK